MERAPPLDRDSDIPLEPLKPSSELFGNALVGHRHSCARNEQEQREAAERSRQWRLGVFLRHVGKRYADARLSDMEIYHDDQKAAIEALQAYCKTMPENIKAGRGIVLFGPPGTGKDHALVAAGKVATRCGDVEWMNGAAFYGDMRDGITEHRSEDKILDKYQSADVLIISDPIPPSGGVTPFQASCMFRIIDYRYRQMRATWVSMNVADGAEAEARLGAAVVDRLRDGSLTLHFNWPSYRGRRNAKAGENS